MSCEGVIMRTENPVEKYEFKWEIYNFSKFHNGVKSAVFTPCSTLNAQFFLEISYSRRNSEPVCVFSLNNYSRVFPKTLSVQSKLNFQPLPKITCSNSKFEFTRPVAERIELVIVSKMYESYIYPELFFQTSQCNDLLVVHCQLELSGHKITTSSMMPLPISARKNSYKLSCNMKTLYSSKKFCDFKIQIGEKTLLAHKSILAARSPVFESMIQSQFQESLVNCVNITDVDYNVFDCFLHYLYCDDIGDKNVDTLCNLYALADRYAVSDLQKECGNALASCLTLDNATRIAKLSFYHNDAPLKEKATSFIAHHFSDMYSKPDWRDILKDFPELSSDILGIVASMFVISKSNTN